MIENMILDKLLGSRRLQEFQKSLDQGRDLILEELWDSAKAALLTLAQQGKRQLLVITNDRDQGRLLDNTSYFPLQNVLEFPGCEGLPEEGLPNPDIIGKRIEILHTLLSQDQPAALITTLKGALQKTIAPDDLRNLCQIIRVGDRLDYATLHRWLESLGYRTVSVVSQKGTYALRHGILDIFPPHLLDPVRLEFFGEEIEEIRLFDPISQKSVGTTGEFLLIPVSEDRATERRGKCATLLDFLSKSCLVIFDGLVSLEDDYCSLKAHSPLFLSWEGLLERLKATQKLYFFECAIAKAIDTIKSEKKRDHFGEEYTVITFDIASTQLSAAPFHHPFQTLPDFFAPLENPASTFSADDLLHNISRWSPSLSDLHFVVANEAEKSHLHDQLITGEIELPERTTFDTGYLSTGFVLVDSLCVICPMAELTHQHKLRREKWHNSHHISQPLYHGFEGGDIVVHSQHGIGKFIGFEIRRNHLQKPAEFLVIEYAEAGKLYVPIQQAHLVSRYVGAEESTPSFHVIGGKQWQRIRLQAEKSVIGYAKDLLRWQAERVSRGGYAFAPDNLVMKRFEEAFPYTPTEDQLRAIAEIKQEMEQPIAMDRLICGDVGYGKTEVAMRAAFKAISCGDKQVAVLVPTTVLAMQHYDNFRERMMHFPIRIASISRCQSAKEVSRILDEVRAGKIDLLIGTHRLLSKDVQFANLGLIIIDEEQRFGVKAKESLKSLKTGVDCLTLSATPIPRTLYLSMVGARTISVINTPPHDRLPVKSLLANRDLNLIRNVLLRELARSGQAFFIHNRVETIFQVQKELQQLLPNAKIIVGHGQMPSDELDAVFHAFKKGDADILVATTIIENGIDIPNANTIFIDDADRFGLADLYQMRGRVGRWKRVAYAYFLTKQGERLSSIAKKRLSAILEAPGYGGGMRLATRDLELRGAGDILGTQQSGHVATIGFHLYCKFLKRAIDAIQKNSPPRFQEMKMEFSFDARIPEEYIVEQESRLEMYHRFGDATTPAEIDSLLIELKDRFGNMPNSVRWLAALTKVKIRASDRGYTLLKFQKSDLIYEKEIATKIRGHTIPLPKISSPEELEAFCQTALFDIK